MAILLLDIIIYALILQLVRRANDFAR